MIGCFRCGRILKDKESITRGAGKVCYDKLKAEFRKDPQKRQQLKRYKTQIKKQLELEL